MKVGRFSLHVPIPTPSGDHRDPELKLQPRKSSKLVIKVGAEQLFWWWRQDGRDRILGEIKRKGEGSCGV